MASMRKSFTVRLANRVLLSAVASGLGALATPASAADPLPGSSIPQFVDPLPPIDVIAGQSQIELRMTEFQAQVLPEGLPKTTVWSYLQPGQLERPSYIGPVVVAERGEPLEVKWVNNLGHTASTNLGAWVQASDQTMHWADPFGNMCAEKFEPNSPPTGECAQHYSGPIPAVPHLHGGEVPPVLDGGPDAWFTSDAAFKGPAFYSRDGEAATNYATYRYPNVQEAAPLWFHDHALGITRLNVYAGLAGAYLLTDPANPPPANLPAPIPLVIQDRMFDEDGQLAYPAGAAFIPNPSHPFWVPEFFGDTIVVNGKAWPYLNVEPKRYRFLFLNGSNARAYQMFLTDRDGKAQGPALWQIGTDGGYLDVPVKIAPGEPGQKMQRLTMQSLMMQTQTPLGCGPHRQRFLARIGMQRPGMMTPDMMTKIGDGAGAHEMQRLVMLPGERADVIIDFAGLAPGTRLLLRNTAKSPFPNGEAAHGATTGRIMEFRVVAATGPDTSYDPASGAPLRTPMRRLVDPEQGTLAADAQEIRQLTLNEVAAGPTTVDGVEFPGGPLEALLNNSEQPGTNRPDFTPISVGGLTLYYSELPREGESEVWEFVNMTGDAHPIHLHLVQFQVMNRQRFDTRKYDAAYNAAFPEGEYLPGWGPPLDYYTGNPRALGGNPDITPFLRPMVRPPAANEAGWKDTVVAYPGQVTRIAVRFAPTDLPVTTAPAAASFPFNPDGGHGYVWHCHILEHEDNEMMRPYSVIANPAARSYVQGVDY